MNLPAGYPDQTRRKLVGWRAALILDHAATPVFGRAMEASEQSFVILSEHNVPAGVECRICLDVLDTQGRRGYLDFRGQIVNATLVGKLSRFRLVCRIVNMEASQREFLASCVRQDN